MKDEPKLTIKELAQILGVTLGVGVMLGAGIVIGTVLIRFLADIVNRYS